MINVVSETTVTCDLTGQPITGEYWRLQAHGGASTARDFFQCDVGDAADVGMIAGWWASMGFYRIEIMRGTV